MKVILSPAKKMLPRTTEHGAVTVPAFLEEANKLCRVMRGFSPWELETLLDTNPELALQAYTQFSHFDPQAAGHPALLSYHGLAYINMAPGDFTAGDFAFAMEHLRLLSGFYGVLRPLDGIQPYRLQVDGKVRVNGESLYQFWGDCWYRNLYQDDDTVVNIASKAFSRAVSTYLQPHDNFITCDFLVPKSGKFRCIVNTAKMARGRMARFVVKNKIRHPKDLQAFDWGGFVFRRDLSTSSRYVFVREEG